MDFIVFVNIIIIINTAIRRSISRSLLIFVGHRCCFSLYYLTIILSLVCASTGVDCVGFICYSSHVCKNWKFGTDKRKSKLLNWPKWLNIIIGIGRGLQYLHQDCNMKVVYRDLKPSNILLDESLNPKIFDFGITRIFEGDEVQERATRRPRGTM